MAMAMAYITLYLPDVGLALVGGLLDSDIRLSLLAKE